VGAFPFQAGEAANETPSSRSAGTTTIAGRIAAAIDTQAAEQLVTDVRIGLGYTAVELDGGRVGVAFTFRDAAQGCCCAFQGMRPLAGRGALELAALVESADPIEAAVGLACINALANEADERFFARETSWITLHSGAMMTWQWSVTSSLSLPDWRERFAR
jgi:hypothetical protein